MREHVKGATGLKLPGAGAAAAAGFTRMHAGPVLCVRGRVYRGECQGGGGVVHGGNGALVRARNSRAPLAFAAESAPPPAHEAVFVPQIPILRPRRACTQVNRTISGLYFSTTDAGQRRLSVQPAAEPRPVHLSTCAFIMCIDLRSGWLKKKDNLCSAELAETPTSHFAFACMIPQVIQLHPGRHTVSH